MPSVEDAVILAASAHRGQRDKAGQVYLLHPLTLMLRARTDEERMAAVLHDVVEDSDTSLADLAAAGYPPAVIAAVDALTRRENETYEAFIERVARDPLAVAVKCLDLEHNLEADRLPTVGPRDMARLERYRQALARLRGETGQPA